MLFDCSLIPLKYLNILFAIKSVILRVSFFHQTKRKDKYTNLKSKKSSQKDNGKRESQYVLSITLY